MIQSKLTKSEAEKIGKNAVEFLNLSLIRSGVDKGRVKTSWGTKSIEGLGRSLERLVVESTLYRYADLSKASQEQAMSAWIKECIGYRANYDESDYEQASKNLTNQNLENWFNIEGNVQC